MSDLDRDLDRIAERATAVLREERGRDATWRLFDGSVPWLLAAVPAAQLTVLLLARLFGFSGGKLPTLFLVSATLAFPAVILGRAVLRALRRRLDPPVALAEVDRRLELADRLTAAKEFLRHPSPSPFATAAIEDAAVHTTRALDADLRRESGARLRRRSLFGTALALLLLIVVVAVDPLPQAPKTPSFADGDGRRGGFGAERDPRADEEPPEQSAPERELAARAPTRDSAREASEPGKAGLPQEESGEDIKKTEGRTQAGQPSQASFSSGSSESRGVPTAQGQTSLSSDKKPKPPKKKKPKPKRDRPEEQPSKKEDDDSSGATAGRGAASGSNKSPSASLWSSKDKVISDDDDELEDDEEVDDEFDIADARAGLQPQLRDRKPPVNRDLTIGFGNQKNPDANGRGGQSEQKKSRGVASLVLGVPIPDHIKGRPNPGKTKVTQERVKPLEEDAEVVAAGARTPRQTALGHRPRPQLTPELRTLIRNYFLSLRQGGVAPVERESQPR